VKAVIRDRGRNYITPTITAVGTTEPEFTVMIVSTITAGFFEVLLCTTLKAPGSHRRRYSFSIADSRGSHRLGYRD
jgi:hypothetical protein